MNLASIFTELSDNVHDASISEVGAILLECEAHD
jgi:hypothetical protein